ncbi:transposase [Candidatus Peregrinibacteria bacterium]|nr:transposase [Candidatus Peregrinibacteria bacterium]
MARVLESRSDTTARHIFKRLDRNLGQYNVLPVKERAQAKQIALINDETFIYFDPTDAIKKYGEEFEAISFVADGSDNHTPKPGYNISACIGLKGSEIIPLEWDIFSSAEEDYESENQKLLHQIDEIAINSKCKGTFVMDRGFDRFVIIRHLQESAINFIIRMTENRHYHPLKSDPSNEHRSYSREDIIAKFSDVETRVQLDIRVKKKLVKKLFIIQSAPVGLREKIDSEKKLALVCAKAKGLMTLYFLTNIEDMTPETLVTIVEAYLNRWKVDEFIRFVKQQYKAEGFKVRSLGRIKNIHALLFIALVVLTRISEQNTVFSKTKSLLIKHAKRVFRIPQKMKFFLYTLADGLSEILKKIAKRILNLWHEPQKRQLQLNFAEPI